MEQGSEDMIDPLLSALEGEGHDDLNINSIDEQMIPITAKKAKDEQ